MPEQRPNLVRLAQFGRNCFRAERTEYPETEWNVTMSEDRFADALGMTEGELYGYLNDLLHEEAAEAAAESGKSIEEELESAGFTAAEAANTYAIKLILANNAFITRQLLDLGILQAGDGAVIE
jgi:hypothetical protein